MGPEALFVSKQLELKLQICQNEAEIIQHKENLGRVWFRYFQLYGMTGKLAIACVDIGWTQVDMDTYAREHYHLVNQLMANMVKDNEPDVPDPGDLEWLTSHPAVAGSGKAPRTQMRADQKKRKA